MKKLLKFKKYLKFFAKPTEEIGMILIHSHQVAIASLAVVSAPD